jgi:AcrR family transcriptional regulator
MPGVIADAQRPLRADARRNRDAILAAAHEVFAEFGREAQIDDVAKRANVGVGTVYRHFPTKEQLLEALAAEQFTAVAQLAREAVDRDDAWEAFCDLLTQAAERLSSDRALSEVIAMAPDAMASVCAAREDLRASAAILLRRAQEAGQVRPDVSADDVPMLMCGVGSAMHSGVAAQGAWRRHLRIVLDGLRADAATEPLPGV